MARFDVDPPPTPLHMPHRHPQRGSHWEDTAFFIGTLLLTAGGGLVIQAGIELPLHLAKLVWGAVGLVWGAVLVRVWIFRENRRRDEARDDD